MLVTQSQSKISKSNLLQDQGNPLMREFHLSFQSTVGAHGAWDTHTAFAETKQGLNNKAFGAYVK